MKPAASLRALLTHLIDYAGLFPPASLSLDESIRNYARYVKDSDAWMLGRFICPAGKLKDLAQFLSLFNERLSISLLAIPIKDHEEFDANMRRTEDELLEFQNRSGARAIVDVLEFRLPGTTSSTYKFLKGPAQIFVERLLGSDWRRTIEFQLNWGTQTTGFKLRTGGVDASAFPPAEQIAFAIASCRENNVLMKFTAGLHHPIRHFDKSVNTKMHGFINVFVAGVVAYALKLSEEQLVPILLDEDSSSFTFDDDELRWKDYRASTQQVADARKQLVTSYGSCSFDEPREDLRSLGWL